MKLKRTFPKPNFFTDESENAILITLEGKERRDKIEPIILAALMYLATKGHQDLTRDELCAYSGINRQAFIKAFNSLMLKNYFVRSGKGVKKDPYRFRIGLACSAFNQGNGNL